MSEGTMQRPAQPVRRNERDRRGKRRHRVLVGAAALPALLLAAGCSSDSGDGGGSSAAGGDGSASASAAPTVQAAAYQKLPDSCAVLSKKTLTSLVPKGAKSGKEGTSSDTGTRASCSWNSLDNNGVKGSQFRWLNVSLLRFESDVTRGEGDKLAQTYFDKQVKDAQATPGAKNTKAQPVTGIGDAATLVRYDLKKKEGAFKQQTIVTRVENVVVTLDYNGAGLAGEKTPNADTLAKLAQKAAAEAVGAVSAANGAGTGTGSGSGSDSGSATTTPAPSKSASTSASPSTAKSATPSKSAAKKS
ncbi:DUF3558 family protein [Streptomyces sp. NPDC088794]|uniref:DUF3558 family protein n=1 Tax=Streptomyces sp. NPDC088794 TaxID=3365902 RepID=UPI00380FBFB1